MDWKELVLEWLEEARQKSEVQAMRPNGSRYKLQALQRAIESIKNGPPTVHDITDLHKLPRVGDKTLELVTQRWKKHLIKHPEAEVPPSFQEKPKVSEPQTLSNQLAGQSYPFAPPPTTEQKTKKRKYIPKFGSAAYYTLITLRENEVADVSRQGIGQTELTRLMKQHTSNVLEGAVSKTTPSVGMALKTLRDHELVYLQNGRYFLDPNGRELATKLLRASGHDVQTPEKLRQLRSSGLEKAESGGFVTDVWQPGTFTTRIVLDSREVASKNDRSGLSNDLRNSGLTIEVKSLSLGDCVWIAEHESGRWAVLDWIVERKTLSDLRSSIHDGRYQEQKQRLTKSTLQHIVYLIEYANNVSNNEMFKENHKKFLTAMSQVLVRHGFHLKLTRSQNETVQYLVQVTKLIEKKYQTNPLTVVVPSIADFEASMREARTKLGPVAIDYSAFHEGLGKSKLRTIGDTFRLVLRAIKGVSAEKAMAIQRVFPTPAHLMQAYLQTESEEGRRELVCNATKHCVRRQQINLPLSATIYEVWSTLN